MEFKEMSLDQADITAVLPHREPVLFAETAKLLSSDEDDSRFLWLEAETTFHIDKDMEVFRGHFPDEPLLPGIYIIEAMAQCADILLLENIQEKGKLPLLVSVSNMRLLRQVKPGDDLVCKAVISIPEESGPDTVTALYDCKVSAFVKEKEDLKKAAQGLITLCLR